MFKQIEVQEFRFTTKDFKENKHLEAEKYPIPGILYELENDTDNYYLPIETDTSFTIVIPKDKTKLTDLGLPQIKEIKPDVIVKPKYINSIDVDGVLKVIAVTLKPELIKEMIK